MRNSLFVIVFLSFSLFLGNSGLRAQDFDYARTNSVLFEDAGYTYLQDDENDDRYGKVDAGTWMGRNIQRIGRLASKATMKGIDTNYIGVPDKPFIVSALYRGMHFTNTAYTPGFNISYEGVEHEFFSTRSEFKLGLSNKLGVGISYRGLGVNLLFNLGNKSGNMFNIAFYQRRFGIELNMQTINDIGATTYYSGRHYSLDPDFGEGFDLRATKVHAYYVFNSERFSFPAIMKFNTIQKRTAGAFFIDVNYFYNKSDISKSVLFAWSFNADKFSISTNQIAIGPGYGINIVPGRGKFMIHASVAPCALITFASHFKIAKLLDFKKIDWSNPDYARYRKELEELLNNEFIQLLDKKLDEMDDEYNDKTNVKFTISGRAGLVYNINKDFVLGLNTSINYFGISNKNMFRTTSDYISTTLSFGYRF